MTVLFLGDVMGDFNFFLFTLQWACIIFNSRKLKKLPASKDFLKGLEICVCVYVWVCVGGCVCGHGCLWVCLQGVCGCGCTWMHRCAFHPEGHQRRMKIHHYTEITVMRAYILNPKSSLLDTWITFNIWLKIQTLSFLESGGEPAKNKQVPIQSTEGEWRFWLGARL